MPVIPTGTLVCNVVTRTIWGYRRNAYYYEPESAPADLAALEAAADAVFNHLQPLYTPLMASHAAFQRVEARYFGASGTLLEANSTEDAVDGEIASAIIDSESDVSAVADMLPDEASLIVQVKTGLTGRNRMGRRFITGLSEQIQNSGVVIPEFKPTAKSLADGISEDVTVSGGPVMHARHWDRVGNLMHPIFKCYAVVTIGTRKDRRRPLRIERI